MSIEVFSQVVQKKAWIYKITIGKKVYVGSTVDINGRKNSHLRELKKSKHVNVKLQRAYNKRKEFIWEILEECNEVDRWKRESHWIAENNSIIDGYNISTVDITKDALEDESLIRLVSNNTDFILLYQKVKEIVALYSGTVLPSKTPRTPRQIFSSLKVKSNTKKEKKIMHWLETVNKIASILDKWQKLPEGHYYWYDHPCPELSSWQPMQPREKYNFTNRPYEFLETLLMNAKDPLFKLIVKKLHTEGLLRLAGYEKYHQPFYGPPAP